MKFKIKYYDLKYIANAITLVWLKEIHIDKRFRNTPIGYILIQHELRHQKFYEKIKKIERNEKNIVKKLFKLLFLINLNNIICFIDSFLIEFRIYIYFLLKKHKKYRS